MFTGNWTFCKWPALAKPGVLQTLAKRTAAAAATPPPVNPAWTILLGTNIKNLARVNPAWTIRLQELLNVET